MKGRGRAVTPFFDTAVIFIYTYVVVHYHTHVYIQLYCRQKYTRPTEQICCMYRMVWLPSLYALLLDVSTKYGFNNDNHTWFIRSKSLMPRALEK